MPAFVKTVTKSLSIILAAGIITAAALVCITRLLTPALNDHRADMERIASNLLHTPVTISQVRATWYQYQPQITLQGVTVFDAKTHQPEMQIKKVAVFISIPKSIIQRQFVVNGVMVSGTSLNINRDTNGNIQLQGFPQFDNVNTPYQTQAKLTDALAWLSQEQKIILRNIDLHYTGLHNEKRFVSLHNFSLSNSGDEHAVVGTATLHQKLPTKVKLALQVTGNAIDLNKLKVNGYVYVTGLDLAQWVSGDQWHQWEIHRGVASSKIWFTWNNGELQKIQSLLQLYGLQLYSHVDRSLHDVNRLSGNFGWERKGQAQTFAGDDVLLDLPGHYWPTTSFSYNTQTRALSLGYVDLNDVSKFLLSSNDITNDQQKFLQKLNVHGELVNTTATLPTSFDNWQQLNFQTSLNQISIKQVNQIPELHNFSADVKWDGAQGNVHLTSKNFLVEDQNYNDNLMQFQQLTGDVNVVYANNIWKLNTSNLQLTNPNININTAGTMTFAANASPYADLQSDFNIAHLETVAKYLPLKYFNTDFSTWVKSAFLSGNASQGHAVIRGALNDFPFDNNNGTFAVTTDVSDANLIFASDWPVINDINAKVAFLGRKITIDAQNANTLNVPLGNVHVEIANVGGADPSILTATSDNIVTNFENGFNYIATSPLKDSLGKMFEGVNLTGPINMKLGLRVPLSSPADTNVNGSISMSDANMDLSAWSLDIAHLNGNLNFTEDSVTSPNITGEFFDKPLTFSLATTKDKTGSVIQAKYKTSLAINNVEQWLQLPFMKPLHGVTDVGGTINFSNHHPFELNLESNLVGVGIDLPNELNKAPDTAKNFNLQLSLADKQPLKIMLDYDDYLNAALLLNNTHNAYELTAADVHIGNGPADWPDSSGLYLSGSFKTLDLDQIQKYIHDAGTTDLNSESSGLSLQGIDVETDELKIAGITLPKVSVQISPEKLEWLANINSPDMSGQINIPRSFDNQQTLIANFSKLDVPVLTSLNTTATKTKFDIKNFPSIIFRSKQTSYAGKQLGQIILQTAPTDEGLQIKALNINSPNISIKAFGSWKQTPNSNITKIVGTANSNQIDNLISSFGIDAKNFIVSTGQSNFNLAWDDTPYNFSMANVSGNLSLKLGKGRIVDIGKESGAKMDLGRMLSIFSLQTIPRRLSFDFSDVFEKGYSFDSVTGNFVIDDGSLFTKDFKFDGPVAKVGISGRIGFVDKDYDFTLIVTPYVTSSIPVAALMLGQPLIGLAAFAVNNVIGSSLISKATTYYYAVSGHWAAPVWKSISASASKYKLS